AVARRRNGWLEPLQEPGIQLTLRFGAYNYVPRRPRVRVLIVEDEKKMAEILKKGLEEHGHLVTLAHTGTEGLAFAETLGFGVVILDIMLPGLDGFEVVRRLRKADNGTPILILTARDGEADLVKGLNLGLTIT